MTSADHVKTAAPAANSPVADNPGADNPGAVTLGADNTGADHPGAVTLGADNPGADNPGAVTPGANHRVVTITRTAPGRFRAVNARGGVLEFGSGDDSDFTPVELLLTAIGGCSGIDVDLITGRRAQPETFQVTVEADKVRDEHGNHLQGVAARFSLTFPEGGDGDRARAVLPEAAKRSHDRLCTVSRTVELPTPVAMSVE